jgi:hypothetical protein
MEDSSDILVKFREFLGYSHNEMMSDLREFSFWISIDGR